LLAYRGRPGVERIPGAFYVRKDNHAERLVKLIAPAAPLDMDDPQPPITVMQPGRIDHRKHPRGWTGSASAVFLSLGTCAVPKPRRWASRQPRPAREVKTSRTPVPLALAFARRALSGERKGFQQLMSMVLSYS